MDRLPAEIRAMVAASVEDPATLVDLAMVNKPFYTTVKRDGARLGSAMCYQRIGHDLMPIALAVALSEVLVNTKPNFCGRAHNLKDVTVMGIKAFIGDHFPEQAVVDRHIDIYLCKKLFIFHNAIEDCASAIAKRGPQASPGGDTTQFMSCTESEMSRICKSLYMLELLNNVYPPNPASGAD